MPALTAWGMGQIVRSVLPVRNTAIYVHNGDIVDGMEAWTWYVAWHAEHTNDNSRLLIRTVPSVPVVNERGLSMKADEKRAALKATLLSMGFLEADTRNHECVWICDGEISSYDAYLSTKGRCVAVEISVNYFFLTHRAYTGSSPVSLVLPKITERSDPPLEELISATLDAIAQALEWSKEPCDG